MPIVWRLLAALGLTVALAACGTATATNEPAPPTLESTSAAATPASTVPVSPTMHVNLFETDPATPTTFVSVSDIKGFTSDYTDVWVAQQTRDGVLYNADSPTPVSDLEPRQFFIVHNVPIKHGSTLVFFLATPEGTNQILEHPLDEHGVRKIGNLPMQGVLVIQPQFDDPKMKDKMKEMRISQPESFSYIYH